MEYKGYKVEQAPNYHVWVTKDGRMVLHAQCNKPKTDDELKEVVDNYIELTESGKFDEIYNETENSEW